MRLREAEPFLVTFPPQLWLKLDCCSNLRAPQPDVQAFLSDPVNTPAGGGVLIFKRPSKQMVSNLSLKAPKSVYMLKRFVPIE